MNRTSPSFKSVSNAARSPGRARTGPDVTRSPTPSSAATIPANDVFPRPGGPAKRRWSTAWPRCFAASRTIRRCSTRSGCPTNSSKFFGRRVASSRSSLAVTTGVTTSPPGAGTSSFRSTSRRALTGDSIHEERGAGPSQSVHHPQGRPAPALPLRSNTPADSTQPLLRSARRSALNPPVTSLR